MGKSVMRSLMGWCGLEIQFFSVSRNLPILKRLFHSLLDTLLLSLVCILLPVLFLLKFAAISLQGLDPIWYRTRRMLSCARARVRGFGTG